MKQVLNNFKLAGYYPYAPLKQHSMELNRELKGCTPWIDAKVPGSVYDDLFRAGLIADPYYNMNSLLCEWVAARWWVYITEFEGPEITAGESAELVLEGIDYKAHIFLNGERLGEHEGMFVPFTADITAGLKRKNILKIVLESAPDEMGQIGRSTEVFTQKSRYAYKWDFSIRMPGMGLTRPAYINLYKSPRCAEWDFKSTAEGALLRTVLEGGDSRVRAELFYAGGTVYSGEADSAGGIAEFKITLKNPRLWYPAGSGEQSLYGLKITVLTSGETLQKRVGLKTLRMLQNPGAPEGALPYVFEVNGNRVYVRGVNFVPPDMQPGTVTRERYRKLLTQIRDMNVNMVRVWGGGVIENEDFYELCDELGLMVWQDFIQSSSGLDNFPSHRPEFLKLLLQTAEYAAKEKRNHVSLAAFCGGNELMFPDWRPVDSGVENIALLEGVIKKHCPHIPFLPATPSGHVFSPDFSDPDRNHDVHGQWTFLGVEEHYRYFNGLRCLFHSEFGVDGLTNYSVAELTMPKEQLFPCDYNNNMYWRHRGDWWNTYPRDAAIFGDITDLREHTGLSQFIQAEGLRYALDAERRRAFYTSGTMLWQANEPFPNGSCTSVIDYYGGLKTAYYACRSAYAPVSGSLSYDKLVYEPGEIINAESYVTATAGGEVTVTIEAFEQDGAGGEITALKKSYTVSLAPDSAQRLDGVSLTAKGRGIRFKLTAESGGRAYVSHILLLVKGGNGFCNKETIFRFNRLLKEST